MPALPQRRDSFVLMKASRAARGSLLLRKKLTVSAHVFFRADILPGKIGRYYRRIQGSLRIGAKDEEVQSYFFANSRNAWTTRDSNSA